MIHCQCPKCQTTFPVAGEGITTHPCPECRHLVNMPSLVHEGGSGTPGPQVIVECPHCGVMFPELPGEAGRTVRCPECTKPVLIPTLAAAKGRKKWSLLLWIMLALAFLFVTLSNISILGTNANTAFNTVGQSMIKTVAP